jgi:cyclic lactone autoinducer peptide
MKLGGVVMLSLVSNLLEGFGKIASSFGTNACILIYIDEPECPKSLIK